MFTFNIRKFYIVFVSFLLCVNSFSQDVWTFERCVKYALDNNIQVQKGDINVEIAKKDNQLAKYRLLPNLNASANYDFNFGRSIDVINNSSYAEDWRNLYFDLGTSVVLYNGNISRNKVKKTKLDLMSVTQDLQRVKNDISIFICSYFIEILSNKALLKIAEDQLVISLQQIKRTEELVNAGVITEGELFTIMAQMAKEKLNVVNLENDLSLSILNLVQLLDMRKYGDFQISGEEVFNVQPNKILKSANEIYNEAIHLMPEIRSQELMMKSVEKQLAIEKGKYLPALSLSGSLMSGYYTSIKAPFYKQIGDNRSQLLQLSLSIPIFNRWETSIAVDKARLYLDNEKLELDISKHQLYKEIQRAHNEATASLAKYYATREAKESIYKSFHYIKEKFNSGLVNSIDYNIAKNKLTAIESGLINAKYNFIFKTKILDFYTMGKIQ